MNDCLIYECLIHLMKITHVKHQNKEDLKYVNKNKANKIHNDLQ